MGFWRGHQGYQSHWPHDDDNKENDDEVEENKNNNKNKSGLISNQLKKSKI